MSLSSNANNDMNLAETPAQTVTNTAYGNLIAKCCITGQTLTLPEYTTLNERYNVLAETSIGVKNGRDFYLKYFTLGIRGSNCIGTNSLGVSQMKVNQHQPTDANLFTPIPIAARPLSSDFNEMMRSQLRMRVVEIIDGTPIAFYYAKLINFNNYNPSVQQIERDVNGNEVANPYIPNRDSLFDPQPRPFTSQGTTPISDTYINSSAILDCTLHQTDLAELQNACKLKFGDASLASPNEVGLCYGIDVQADGQIGGGAVVRYTEAMSLVIAHFITERDGRSAVSNTQINLAFDHGASEPMLLHQNSTTGP